MPAKKSPETFLMEMSVKHPMIKVIDTYKNSTTALHCRCLKDGCGYEWMSTPHNLLSGHGCPKCGGTLRKTHSQFVAELQDANRRIDVIGQYRDQRSKIRVKCKIDGHEWDAWPENLLRGNGCPKCSARESSIRNTCPHDSFVAKMSEINPNIEVLGHYQNNSTRILCRCLLDGNEWETRPANLLRGKGCPECKSRAMRMRTKPHDEFVNAVRERNPKAEVIGMYVNSYTKVLCRCTLHNETWEAYPGGLLKGQGCHKCSSSRGEAAIASFLSKHGIAFEQFYKFNDCRNKRPLPFDFFVQDYNLCIEYDGKQHFEPISFGASPVATAANFDGIQTRDAIKNQYCRSNGIDLLRIPYTDFEKIDDILTDKLHIT